MLATGGQSLPRTGSDGGGYKLARDCGLPISDALFPALVPLRAEAPCFVTELSGISADVALELRGPGGKRLVRVEGPMLCTHFGISGPAALDVSRSWNAQRITDPKVVLVVDWLPGVLESTLNETLRTLGARSVARWLRERLPERLALALCGQAGIDGAKPAADLTREQRRAVVRIVKECPLPLAGDRGWNHAEVTAGGVPLSALDLKTLEARACPGLHLCGEICDVEGRLGGFNFQWAWASGFVAGVGAAR